MPTSLTPRFGASETSSSRRPSPASSGGSGSSTASPPPAASMGTTASSKLGPTQARWHDQKQRQHHLQRKQYASRCQARTTARGGRSGNPTAAGSIESASQMVSLAAFCNLQ
ncbi:hypothetical protein PR002_g28686 [Phytophthora rubi]|uniref:Uncharacterized protein n=2 Tax=Phytophthora rubi TaxID=129364 RepID=A0A6A3H8V2_9STRA|nr:hypothetical protein PR002_g28686 [Phytophthora rubi]